MLKALFISMLLLSSLTAHAAPKFTALSWGLDGASSTSKPSADSEQWANQVFAGLGGTDSQFEIETDEMSIEVSPWSVSIIILDHTEEIQLTKNSKSNADVLLTGNVAKSLYEKLIVSPVARVGATSKTAGNVQCVVGVNAQGNFYGCRILDVDAARY